MNAPIVGITGLPCAGKSLAARLLATGEVTGVSGVLLSADDIGHAVLARPEVSARLRRRFGDLGGTGDDPGAIRRRIAAVVFADPAELAWLESVVHPLVTAEVDRAIAARGGRPVVIEAALLNAAGLDRRCDAILVVEATDAIRLARAARRGWSAEDLRRREARLRDLLTPGWLASLGGKLVRIRNDNDDDRLGGRIRQALAARPEKERYERIGNE
ncbi:MAG: dephospho-CoA kinase [Planctomycetes bacterium]|nr:dephospho-CoA kinase [Planctomycetota bacterium]